MIWARRGDAIEVCVFDPEKSEKLRVFEIGRWEAIRLAKDLLGLASEEKHASDTD